MSDVENLIHNMCSNANDLQLRGVKSKEEASELYQYEILDSATVSGIEARYDEITRLAEEVSSIICSIPTNPDKGVV